MVVGGLMPAGVTGNSAAKAAPAAGLDMYLLVQKLGNQ